MSIVITGSNGKLGALVIDQLLQNETMPAPIAAGVRRLESGSRYEQLGLSVRQCDYDQPQSLERAFSGATVLLFISSSHQDDTVRMRQHAHVIEAAKTANVQHIVYTSFAFPENGSGSPAHLHLATEYAIRASGISFTFLRNALYTDFVGALPLKAAIQGGRLEVAPGNWSFNSVTRDDLALAIAAVLKEPVAHRNAIYELTASQTWSFRDLALALSELSGQSIELMEVPQPHNWLYRFLGNIDTRSTSSDLATLIGKPSTPLLESLRPFFPQPTTKE